MPHQLPSAYLAGPDVFFPHAISVGGGKKELLLQQGIIGHFPLDNEVLDGPSKAHAIFLENVHLIDQSDIVLANIVPFRGPSLDPGTAWEIGYAYARGIPIICYGSSRTYIQRCRYLGLESAVAGLDPEGLSIEDFDEPENLMISRCATRIVATFEEAVIGAKELLGTHPTETSNE